MKVGLLDPNYTVKWPMKKEIALNFGIDIYVGSMVDLYLNHSKKVS